MRARWTIAGWPTDYWAGQVYPESRRRSKAKRRLAHDLLCFCRLTDEDGKGTSGWRKHLRTLSAAVGTADEARPDAARAARPGHRARPRPRRRHALARRARRRCRTAERIAPNMPTEEIVHEPRRPRDERDVPLHVPALVPRPADRGAARRVRRTAGSSGSRPTRTPTATSSPRTSTPTGRAPARRGRARRRVVPDRPDAAASTTTRCSTRTPRRTSRSAAASAARASESPARGVNRSAIAPRRDDRQPQARGDRLRRARPADPADPRRPLADLKLPDGLSITLRSGRRELRRGAVRAGAVDQRAGAEIGRCRELLDGQVGDGRLMKSCQISAGSVPPTTSPTPSTL